MLDLLALDSFRNLRKTFSELKACDDAHTSGVVIPFLQPVLEIFASVQTHYLDESSFANEIGRCPSSLASLATYSSVNSRGTDQ